MNTAGVHDTLKATVAALIFTLVASGCGSNSNNPAPVVIPQSSPAVSGTFTAGIPHGAALDQGASGPDGRTWFAEFNTPAGDAVAAVTAAGVVSTYPTGAFSQPGAIILGPDNNMWAGGYGPGIHKITPAGVVTNYALPGSHIQSLTLGADNTIWFADYGNRTIGKITTAGAITSYPVPAGVVPRSIASGGDGDLWLADPGNGAIDQYSTAGALLHTYTAGITSKNIFNIIGAPDGNLYATEDVALAGVGDHILKISTSGVITELAALPPLTFPYALAIGKDGNLYFSENNKPNVGRVVLSTGGVSEFPIVLANEAGTEGITPGPDGRLWLGGFSTIYALTY